MPIPQNNTCSEANSALSSWSRRRCWISLTFSFVFVELSVIRLQITLKTDPSRSWRYLIQLFNSHLICNFIYPHQVICSCDYPLTRSAFPYRPACANALKQVLSSNYGFSFYATPAFESTAQFIHRKFVGLSMAKGHVQIRKTAVMAVCFKNSINNNVNSLQVSKRDRICVHYIQFYLQWPWQC